MSYVDRVLQPGEHVVVRARLHWVIYLGGLACLVAAIVIAVAAFQAPYFQKLIQFFAALLALAGLALLLRAWWHRWGVEIAVTNHRVIYKRGVIRRRTLEMNLGQIESIQVDQSILGRLLRFGDIVLLGTGEGRETIRLVADPLAVRSAVTAR